jgi:CzcA family heavy metal efflux pump
MLNNFIKFSLSNKHFILLVYSLLLVYGLYVARRMDVDVFPDLTAPTVVVMTDAHGMASEEVERLVTFPVESALNGATDVRRVRSVSSQGFSFVWVEFDWGTEIFRARQIVSERLIGISSSIPEGVSTPVLAPQSSMMGEIQLIGMQADTTPMMDLRTLAEWEVKPIILSTTGVSQVTIMGGEYKQYQVMADPVRMNTYGVTLEDVAAACQSISWNSAGGILREYGNEYVVRGISRTSDINTLSGTFVRGREGRAVRLSDVAEVRIGHAPKMGYASGNAKPAIILSVSKQPNANTIDLTKRIEQNLSELRQILPADIVIDTGIFRQADFINTSINNVQHALIEGAIFVAIILLFFLGSFRTTIISLLAIPLSLLGAILVLHWLGMTINTMSLGGMAIAIGALVDDAIIDVENVHRRLRQNHLLPESQKQTAFTVVYEASKEIRASILNATLIIIVAFFPLFFLSGMEGRMLQPLGITFIVSLFVSLIVAMSVTPVLAQMMLSGDRYLTKNEKEKWVVRKLTASYLRTLGWALGHKRLILFSTGGLFIVSVFIFMSFGRSFLPEFNEGALTIAVVTKPGTSLEESNMLGNLVERELLTIPEVTSTARRTGRGELDEHSQSSNSAEVDVNFRLKRRSREEFTDEVRQVLSEIPGIATSVGQPLGHRIDHVLSGTSANIAIKIFGPDLGRLFSLGTEIQHHIAGINGLVDVNVDQQIETPQLQIRANREMLAAYGITMEQFHHFVETALGGTKVAEVIEGQRSFDLVLRFGAEYTDQRMGIHNALIDTESGGKVPLEQVADIVSSVGPSSITRENVQRNIVVAANVSGKDLRSVVDDIKHRIDQSVTLPEGYRIEYGGQFESEAKASRTLMITTIFSLIIIFFILLQEFRDYRLAAIILLNLPLALIGGVFAIWITSSIVSIPAIIGFITLFGIATRNGILLISNYNRLQLNGTALEETVTRGSADRLNAILMTALTAALALIPLALRGNLSGNEIQSPMAIVILGGLLTSTILNIYIVPIVYSLLHKRGIIKPQSS